MGMAEWALKPLREEGIPVDTEEKNPNNIVRTLNFVRSNVLNVSDVTRTKKLTQILNSFAGRKSEEIFVVQNSKKKDAQGALIDVDYLLELLKYKAVLEEMLEESVDSLMIETVRERLGLAVTKTIGEVAEQFGISWDELMEAKGRVEID